MIISLLTALVLQAQTPETVSAAMALWERCPASLASAYQWDGVELSNGVRAETVIRARDCTFEVREWVDDGGAWATEVRDRLQAQDPNWQVERWRERTINESGPRRWSLLRLPNGPDERAWTLRIVEPETGAPPSLIAVFERSE